jgi:hypothetical protein
MFSLSLPFLHLATSSHTLQPPSTSHILRPPHPRRLRRPPSLIQLIQQALHLSHGALPGRTGIGPFGLGPYGVQPEQGLEEQLAETAVFEVLSVGRGCEF